MSEVVGTALDVIAAGSRACDVESATLDFKGDGRSADDTVANLAAALACFANAQGGTVVVGVADAVAGPAAFVGTRLDPDTTKHQVFERTDPHLVVAVEVVEVLGVRLLLASTPASSTVHSVSGRHTERLGPSCHPMSAERITQVMLDRRSQDWSALDSGIGTAQADAVALAHARSYLADHPSPRSAALARLADTDLLRALGVSTSSGTLTNAGALLFTTSTAPMTSVEQIAYVYRRSVSGSLVANEQLPAPLMTALHRTLELIDARLDRTSVNLAGGRQIQVGDVPEAVIREAVVNAVMHRDYRSPDRIVIDHSPGRLTVTSPGGFVSGVSTDTVLTTSSRVRNAQLAGAIRSLGLAETAGTGVDRMFAEMARTGYQPPAYAAGPSHVTLTLVGGTPNGALLRFVTTLAVETRDNPDAMLTLRALLDAGKVTAATMANAVQRSVDETEQVLARLAAAPDGFAEPTRESQRWVHPEYRLRQTAIAALGSAVTSRRRSAEESEHRILDLLRESQEITPGMVRVMLGVQPATVSRLLAAMVDRGLLARTSQATRGSGVTYGPGPNLPRREGRVRETTRHDAVPSRDITNEEQPEHTPFDDAFDGDHE